MGRSLSWSATRAHSSDSMAPSSAMVSVGTTSSLTVSQENSGRAKAGRPCGMPPKREPMVSTGSDRPQASSDRLTSAMTGAGTREVALRALTVFSSSIFLRKPDSLAHSRGHRNSPNTHNAASASDQGLRLCRWRARVPIWLKKSAGIF